MNVKNKNLRPVWISITIFVVILMLIIFGYYYNQNLSSRHTFVGQVIGHITGRIPCEIPSIAANARLSSKDDMIIAYDFSPSYTDF